MTKAQKSTQTVKSDRNFAAESGSVKLLHETKTMKHTTITIKPQGKIIDGPVTECFNLIRRVRDGREGLGIAPGIVAVAEGECRPLATRYRSDGSSMTLWTRRIGGASTGLWSNTSTAPDEFLSVAEGVTARCAMATATGFIVMTDEGPLTLTEQEDDGTLTTANRISGIAPKITIEGVAMGELSATLPAMTMSNVDFSRTSPQLRQSDIKTLGNNLTEAYMMLAATAADGGMWLQPVAARWHLVSDRGERIYSSSPIVIAPAGWQCCSEISAECSKNGSDLNVPSIRLTATAYRIRLSLDAETALELTAAGVAAIEVSCTPQLHIIDSNGAAPWRLTRQSTDKPLLTTAVPGATDHFCSRESIFTGQMAQMIASIGTLESTAATIEQPIVAGTTTVVRATTTDTTTEIKQTQRVVSDTQPVYHTPTVEESILAQINPPNSFTAATVAVSGETVAWGDITPIIQSGINVEQLCSQWADGSCDGILRIIRRDGSMAASSFSLGRSPGAWTAAVLVPDTGVASLEIYVRRRSDGSMTYGHLTLSTMPDGRHAGKIFPDLCGEKFQPWTGAMPSVMSGVQTGKRNPGMIVAASSRSPLQPLSAIECCHSPIRKLMPAVRSQSTWDFSRCHLYALSAAAIHAVSLSPRQRLTAATMIDPRGIESECSATRTDGKVVALHRGEMIRLQASRTETEIMPKAYRETAWEAAAQRLWLLDQQGNLSTADGKTGRFSDVGTPVDIEHIHTADNRLWIADSDALYRMETDAETDSRTGTSFIRWRSDIPLPGKMCRIEGLELRMSARSFKGTIMLRGKRISGTDSESLLLRLDINGAVDAPIRMRMAAPVREWAEIDIDGETSTDFRLDEIIFKMKTGC